MSRQVWMEAQGKKENRNGQKKQRNPEKRDLVTKEPNEKKPKP